MVWNKTERKAVPEPLSERPPADKTCSRCGVLDQGPHPMETLSPMIRTLGRVVDGGSAAPGLQTEIPAEDGDPTLVQLVRYVPVSSQVNPDGQHVCWFGQQTPASYGQHPLPLPEYLAEQTVPTVQIWAAAAAVVNGGGEALSAAAPETRRSTAALLSFITGSRNCGLQLYYIESQIEYGSTGS
jgi:hypothetical protein